MIFVDRTHDDVRGAPSGELSTDGEQLEHFVVAIGSGAEELHRVRGLQRCLADNLDGGPSHGATLVDRAGFEEAQAADKRMEESAAGIEIYRGARWLETCVYA